MLTNNRPQSARGVSCARSRRLCSLQTDRFKTTLGHYYPVDLDAARIERIFSTIIKGLYYRVCKERLPDGCTFEIGRLDPLHVDEVWDQWQSLAHNGPFRLGRVFGCAFMHAADVPGATLWLLWFYGPAHGQVTLVGRNTSPLE